MEAYCVQCKQKREMQIPQATFTSAGTPATKGACPVCGTALFRMGRTDAHDGLEAPGQSRRKSKRARQRQAARQAGHRRIPGQGTNRRPISGFGLHRAGVRWAMSGICCSSKFSVDVDHGFTPQYRVPNEKREVVATLKSDAAKAEEVFLATDPDREGEAIAWHLLEAAGHRSCRSPGASSFTRSRSPPSRRHSAPARWTCTWWMPSKPAACSIGWWATTSARCSGPRSAVGFRPVGCNRLPFAWWSTGSGRSGTSWRGSTGRSMPSCFNRRSRHPSAPGWSEGMGSLSSCGLRPRRNPSCRTCRGRPTASAASGEACARAGQRRRSRPARYSRMPHAGSVSLPAGPWSVAQQLYEGVELGEGGPIGLITYMRTDSHQRLHAGSERSSPGDPAELRRGLPAGRAADLQDADARRPGGTRSHPPDLSLPRPRDRRDPTSAAEQRKLYTLVWQRFLASQMNPAEYDTLTIEVDGSLEAHEYRLRLAASSLRFLGFLAVYQDSLRRTARKQASRRPS